MDQYELWSELESRNSVEDTIETEGERVSTQASQALNLEDAHSAPTTRGPRSQGSLPLLQLADWDKDGAYDECPPTCIHYSIEWRLTVNSKPLTKETEPNLVPVPSAFWATMLRPKLDKVLARKLSQNRSFRTDDTTVAVSVTDRTERDLVKRFDDLDIDWSILEKQLRTWSQLFRSGKKLRVDISFNYIEVGDVAVASARQGTKWEYPSASQHMLSERGLQLDTEEDTTGHPSIWRDVYSLMRCLGQSCNLGPHCWIDSAGGKRHYRLKTHHPKSLIKHVEQGGTLRTHDDVPVVIGEALYAEEQQDAERQRKRRAPSLASCPPINITNVLPAQSQPPQVSALYPAGSAQAPIDVVESRLSTRLQIPGPLDVATDVAVKRYTDWQCSRVSSATLKMEYRKTCDLTLADGLDLELVYEDQDAEFYVKKGVKSGVARRYVRDIETWANQETSA